jgi:hypothetical protein
MDKNLRRLLIIVVLVSFIFSSSAQNPTSSKEYASRDIHIKGVCIPGTKNCNDTHHGLVIAGMTEEAVTSEPGKSAQIEDGSVILDDEQ